MVIMDEIKGLYLKRQYKLCSARCIEVLKNIKDPVSAQETMPDERLTEKQYRVHPLHAIYLSFYVASSLELTARALHVNSSNKLPLLQESLHYYKNAESSMEFASFSANPSVDRAARQRSCSIASSIRSSVDSVFTHSGSTSSSALPSPTASLCDPNSDNEQSNTNTHHPHRKTSGQLRMKKKVSFSTRDHIAITDPESSDDETALIDAFPQPPRSTTPTQERESDASISEFLLSRSLARYSAHLSDFQIQIAYHIGSVNAQIHTVQTCRKARRSNLPDLFTTDFGSGGLNGVDKMEFKKVELKARIGKVSFLLSCFVDYFLF